MTTHRLIPDISGDCAIECMRERARTSSEYPWESPCIYSVPGPLGVGAKPGLWTGLMDWTVDWHLDWVLDWREAR